MHAATLDASASDKPPLADEAPKGRIATFKHSRASRWMHWINFPLLTIMIWSGLRIYWADLRDPVGVGIGAWHWFDLFPDWFNERLGLERRLARGLAFHLAFGWLFTFNGIAYGIYLWRSGEWRHLIPGRGAVTDCGRVFVYDLTFGKVGTLPPQGRYNAAQRVSYTAIIAMGGLVVLTGLAIYRPTQLSELTTAFGGYESARTIHFLTTMGFLLFFVVHLMQVIRAGWANFASMITGYQLESKKAYRARLATASPQADGANTQTTEASPQRETSRDKASEEADGANTQTTEASPEGETSSDKASEEADGANTQTTEVSPEGETSSDKASEEADGAN
ncbi:MAG: cytochrome b/b6 domain-containing protein, partial [Actinomycetota bacterium]